MISKPKTFSDPLPIQGELGSAQCKSLVEAARRGDRAAFDQLCDQLRPELLRWASRYLGADLQPKLGPSDLVQMSLLEAFEAFERFEHGDESEFLSWLYRILSNNLIDVARQYRGTQKRCANREVPIDATDCEESLIGHSQTASSIIRRREVDEEMLRAVAKLPRERRQVVQLRYRDGLTHAEISQRLGITESSARKIFSRAITQLRSLLSGTEHVIRPDRSC